MVDSASSTLRVINGVPGAANIGRTLAGIQIQKAVVSLKNDYAVALTLDGSEILTISNLSTEPTAAAIPGVYSGAAAIALSSDESLVAVYNPGISRIQVLRGLPANPAIQFEADTSGAGLREMSALAVSADHVLAAFSDTDNDWLYLFPNTGGQQFIGSGGRISAIGLGSGHAVVADRLLNEIVLFQDVAAGGARIQLASEADGISDPVGVLLSADSHTAWVANAASGAVTAIDLAGGAPRSFSCDCRPDGLRPLRSPAHYVLTQRSDEPVVLFDGGSANPAFIVVPPAMIRQPVLEVLP
jgi:DNA-binding beta-propeller fold protein YncE